jgi:hypothetical protein
MHRLCEDAMKTESPAKKYVGHQQVERPPVPVKRLIAESWTVLTGLVFLIFLGIGIDERTAIPLVVILSTAVAAELVAGAICLLKGYKGVGWMAVLAWLSFPIGGAISSALFPGSSEPALLGTALATGLIMVLAGEAAVTAPSRARWGSVWDRAGWDDREDPWRIHDDS